MQNRGQMFVAILLIVFGVLLLAGKIFDFNVGAIFLPVVFIMVGIWLIFRPQLEFAKGVNIRPIGEIRRYGEWQVADEEIWAFVGEVDLDMTQADIPPGETCIRILEFVGDHELLLPEGVGFSLSSMAFVSSLTVMGRKRDVIFSAAQYKSEDYETAERKIRLELTGLVAEVDVRRIQITDDAG